MATTDQTISLHKRKLKSLASDIIDISEQGKLAVTDASHVPMFRAMILKLDSLFEKVNQIWDLLAELYVVDKPTEEFPTSNEKAYLTSVKSHYYLARSFAIQLDTPSVPPTSDASANLSSLNCTHSRARLPKISLPRFNGHLPQWPLFRDSFTSLVNNDTTLSKIEKYHFLVGALDGPALTLIRALPLTEDNYEQAWQLLISTYNNRRKLGSAYINQILNFSLPSGKPTPQTLQSFLLTVSESVNSFNNLNIPAQNQAGFILFELAIRCLDPITREAVELEFVDTEFPQFSNLVDLVRSRCEALSLMSDTSFSHSKNYATQSRIPPTPNKLQPKYSRTSSPATGKPSASFFTNSSKQPSPLSLKSMSCFICKRNHKLVLCPSYVEATPERRLELLRNWTGCRNCLYLNHKTKECPSTFSCRLCGSRHHTTLHLRPKTNTVNDTKSQHETSSLHNAPPTDSGATLTHFSSQPSQVLLGTARAHIKDAHGEFKPIRLVIDSGSQYSFITTTCVKALGLPIVSGKHNITGLGQAPLGDLKGTVRCVLSPIGKMITLETDAIVVPSIIEQLPQSSLPFSVWKKYLGYHLSDPLFYEPGPIDVLIGADLSFDVIVGAPIILSPNEPKVVDTLFGHIIAGRFFSNSNAKTGSTMFTTEAVDNLLYRFWQLEEVPKPSKTISPEELRCEKHFQHTHYRLPEGRYVVSLPFKTDKPSLGQSKSQALRRLYSLENKLSRNQKLSEAYCTFMEEYFNLGHMRLSQETALFVIPHHAVFNANSMNPKLRVVFDGSAKATGTSLNDLLLAGPKLQRDISDILLNFRRYKYVLTADIVKMYRQIQLHEPDQAYQHILWRSRQDEEVREYQLTTVTYGLTSAPYLALRVVNQLIEDEGSEFPLASFALRHHIYVDDVASGADTSEELHQLKDQLIQLLNKGCFSLSKWASNCPQILNSVETSLQPFHMLLPEEEKCSVKILGMHWDWKSDMFSYSVERPQTTMTKRAILSCIARIFDPLGYLSPIVFFCQVNSARYMEIRS